MRRLLFSLLRFKDSDGRCGWVPMNEAMLRENPVRLYGLEEGYFYKTIQPGTLHGVQHSGL